MDYLKEFLNLEEYETYKNGEDFALPNVSLINEPYSVKYTPYTPPNYFRITSLANVEGEIYFDAVRSSSYPQDESWPITLEYCVNGDGVWTSITGEEHIQITLPANGYVELRGDNISMCNYMDNNYLYWNLSVDFNHNLSGDIMSICGFSDTLENYHFYHFFENNTTLIDASNLILSATVLEWNCYRGMFKGCTSLTTAPELPATTLSFECYEEMFRNCTSLVNAPKLPANKLINECYELMFSGCTSLTTAPELPATELEGSCYRYMFAGCTSLNYIKAMFTTTPSDVYTLSWVSGVVSSGTFIKNSNATWNVTGYNGIPSGWTIQTYNPYVEEYFTTVAREDGTISFNILKSMGTDMITSISYSTDNGETWVTTPNQNNKSEHLSIDVNVNDGDKVMWKGSAQQLGYYDEDHYGDVVGSFFSSTCKFDAQGNIMSLLYGDNYKNQMTIEETYAFAWLFSDYDEEKTCGVVNAKDLSLPATTLTDKCYYGMFSGCTSLTTVPELPVTQLTDSCYSYMFSGCTSLTTAPELPATTLADSCYTCMFKGCTSLTTAPELPATTLATYCYNGMFSRTNVLPDCSNIDFTSEAVVGSCGLVGLFKNTKVTDTDLNRILPKNANGKYCLPVMVLTNGCYDTMFYGCTNLTTAPELPATTLASSCYDTMFIGCTSLVTAPTLPATTLANDCYSRMFQGCTSLVNAPELPATALVTDCYEYMFNGCTNLNYIKAMFTTTPSRTYTDNWVNGVASTGTFVKNSAATWNVTGYNGIPSGWTVRTASE